MRQRFCKDCGELVGKGKSYCEPCRQSRLTHPPRARFCKDCSVPVANHQHRCQPCQKSREEALCRIRNKRRTLLGPFVCQNPFCGKGFSYVNQGSKGRKPQRYCSKACSHVLAGVIRTAVTKARRSLKREGVALWIATRKGKVLLKRDARTARRAAGRRCQLCDAWFLLRTKNLLRSGRNAKYCPDCRCISDRIEKFGVAYESVNPYTVFERDGWTCRHCEYVTPEWLRGLGAEGPTLDHILPLAKGGAHSYANTQCLCSACNSKKSDRLELEPRLVGVTDFTPFMVAKMPARLKGEARQQTEPKKCGCCCGEMFTPYADGNTADYKKGHWNRVRPPTVSMGCFSKWPPTHAKRLHTQRLAGHRRYRTAAASAVSVFAASVLDPRAYVRSRVWSAAASQ